MARTAGQYVDGANAGDRDLPVGRSNCARCRLLLKLRRCQRGGCNIRALAQWRGEADM